MAKTNNTFSQLLGQGFRSRPNLRVQVWNQINTASSPRRYWHCAAAAVCLLVVSVGIMQYEKAEPAVGPGYHAAVYTYAVSQRLGEAGPCGLELQKGHISFR